MRDDSAFWRERPALFRPIARLHLALFAWFQRRNGSERTQTNDERTI